MPGGFFGNRRNADLGMHTDRGGVHEKRAFRLSFKRGVVHEADAALFREGFEIGVHLLRMAGDDTDLFCAFVIEALDDGARRAAETEDDPAPFTCFGAGL